MAVSMSLVLAYYRWGGWRTARMGAPAHETQDAPAIDAAVANEEAPDLAEAVAQAMR